MTTPHISEHEEHLQQRIGYRFVDPLLLREALTHKSYSNEHPQQGGAHNERLEFLGDAALELVISQAVFRDYPALPEGELTRIRAEVVSEQGLAVVAGELALGDCLYLGRGEERSGGRQKSSLLADALEALLGALFCDGGFDQLRGVAETLFAKAVQRSARRKVGVDHKTRLQELFQARHGRLPVYHLTQVEGPDHQRLYSVEVCFDDVPIGRGQGRTKKGAEQEAARQALQSFGP